MLIHDFGIVGEKKDVHLHDDLILYMIDTFEWIKTFSELESNIEKNGLNHSGITYFKGESVTKLKNIILHWINIFNLGEKTIELRGLFSINEKKHSYNKISKKYLIENLKKLVLLCEKAEKENKIIEHWGI